MEGRGVAVTDLNSTNGTFLNDKRIAVTTPLKPGDRLQLGSHILVYHDQDSVAAAPAGAEGTMHGGFRGVRVGR